VPPIESNLSYWLKGSRTVADQGRFPPETAEARENAALRSRVTELKFENEIRNELWPSG
jgi:hypothetical protein